MLIPPVPPGVAIPPEPPEVGARALYVAARLLAGATTFFFLAFLFAYFYLRSLNENDMWKPAHVKPEPGLGAAIVACVVVSALLAILAGRQMKRRQRAAGPAAGAAAVALVLGLAAVVLQCMEYTVAALRADRRRATPACSAPGRRSTRSRCSATMYWLETQVATELRARRAPAAARRRHRRGRQADRPGPRRGRLLLVLPRGRSGR